MHYPQIDNDHYEYATQIPLHGFIKQPYKHTVENDESCSITIEKLESSFSAPTPIESIKNDLFWKKMFLLFCLVHKSRHGYNHLLCVYKMQLDTDALFASTNGKWHHFVVWCSLYWWIPWAEHDKLVANLQRACLITYLFSMINLTFFAAAAQGLKRSAAASRHLCIFCFQQGGSLKLIVVVFDSARYTYSMLVHLLRMLFSNYCLLFYHHHSRFKTKKEIPLKGMTAGAQVLCSTPCWALLASSKCFNFWVILLLQTTAIALQPLYHRIRIS